MSEMIKMNNEELADYLLDSIFNEDVYEIFPALEECYNNDPSLMENIFMEFYKKLCDLSKPIAKPLLDERFTYIYRKVHGLYDGGVFQSKSSIGKEFNITGVRIGQFIRYCNRVLVSAFIRDYNAKVNGINQGVTIEELGLSIDLYLKLKRLGIDYLSEIDLDSLKDYRGFGDRTIEKINDSISRVRK